MDSFEMKYHKWFIKGIPALNEMITTSRSKDHEKRTVSFSGFMMDEIIEIIRTGIDTDKYARETIRTSIRATLFDYDLKCPFELDDFSDILKKKLESSKGREEKYILLSGFYLKGNLSFTKIKMPNALITLYPATSHVSSISKFIASQNEVLSKINEEPQLHFPYDQVVVKVFVKASSKQEAADKAISSLDQLRGLLNFSFNSRKINSKSMGKVSETRVFNGVVGFRFQSLHDKYGKVLENGLYYTRLWDKPKKAAQLITQKERHAQAYFLKALKRLRLNHGLHKEAWEGLLIYCRALDTPTYQNAFSKLWGVMEYLSGVLATESHEKIVSRNAFLFSDPHQVELILNHLRVNRNELVHTGTELDTDHEEVLIYQLNRYVCSLLARYIFNGLNFKTRSDFISFLDHPRDANQAKLKYEIAKTAYDFRK